jgi:hypothetical protein
MSTITNKILKAGLTPIQIYVVFEEAIVSDSLQGDFNQIVFNTGETIETNTLTSDLNTYDPKTDTFTSYYYDVELTRYFRK